MSHDKVDATKGNPTSPLEKKDPLKVWQEMKRNGFLSTSLGRVPTPKKCDKKRKHEICNRKLKIRKVEDKVEKVNRFTGVDKVNRFTKIAPPSGLLDKLSPGIINRVRSSEQVHSMLQAILRREKSENVNVQRKQAGESKEGDVIGCLNGLSEAGKGGGCCVLLNRAMHIQSEHKGGDDDDDDLGTMVTRVEHEADKDELKSLSSVSMASENASSVSNEDSTYPEGVSSVPRKDATVASQWLQLLHRDITGRLAALKRSRMRVQDVIQIELPFLLSKEFSPNQEGDHSAAGCSIIATRDMHEAKWKSVFNQMDKALNDEANQLEIWLNQVTEMQLKCEEGYVNWYARHYLQHPSVPDCDTRLMAVSNQQST